MKLIKEIFLSTHQHTKYLSISGINEKQPRQESLCVVRLTTTYWHDKRGSYLKKSLVYLKRKCKDFNILHKDCYLSGADAVLPLIINLNEVEDGVYIVTPVNVTTDVEGGWVDGFEYKLVAFKEDL